MLKFFKKNVWTFSLLGALFVSAIQMINLLTEKLSSIVFGEALLGAAIGGYLFFTFIWLISKRSTSSRKRVGWPVQDGERVTDNPSLLNRSYYLLNASCVFQEGKLARVTFKTSNKHDFEWITTIGEILNF